MTLKRKQVDLTKGSIISALVALALPIMGTSFIQMAYNLTDMFWIGFIGSHAVAAVGIAGFFVWLSSAFVLWSKTGTEVKVAQATGDKNDALAEKVARTGLNAIFVIALIYMVILWVFNRPFVLFFNTADMTVNNMAMSYLKIVTFGMLFNFSNQVFTGIFNGRGDSLTPFIFNTLGLVLNIVLDPVLIKGIGVFPEMGVAGAALATVVAQTFVFLCFFTAIKFRHHLFDHFRFFKTLEWPLMQSILKMGFPSGVQSAIFTMISMVIARIVGSYGATPIGVQKVGSQIESLSWMTAQGFAVALGAFVGQNYGAKQYDRVLTGYKKAMKLMLGIGVFNTLLLFFGAKWLFLIFIREPEALPLGIDYLKILALSQLFMCIEIAVSGVFNGMGDTKPPAIIGVVFNAMRIPMALIFSSESLLGLNGIWWSITLTSIMKGIVAYIWLSIHIRHKPEFAKSLMNH